MSVRSVLSNILFFIGFISFISAGFFITQRFQPQDLAFASVPETNNINVNKVPLRMYIPILSKTLPVYKSTIKNNIWETTDKGVSYLTSSGIPGERGNAVFYGHNLPYLLGDLDSVTIGSYIFFDLGDLRSVRYQVVEKKVVKPSDTSILAPTKDSILTLYTCTGFLDSERLVVIAKLSN